MDTQSWNTLFLEGVWSEREGVNRIWEWVMILDEGLEELVVFRLWELTSWPEQTTFDARSSRTLKNVLMQEIMLSTALLHISADGCD